MYAVCPEVSGISSIATQVTKLRDTKDRTIPVYGVAIHCTGSGVVSTALEHKVDPLEYAINHYLNPNNYFAHYVVGFDGHVVQIADEHEKACHIGFGSPEDNSRENYLLQKWEDIVPAAFVQMWKKRWMPYKSPSHLYPGASPNNAYVGVEMLVWQQGCVGTPIRTGYKYTKEQHDATAALCADIAKRWSFPNGWRDTGRLACHEDITPISRSTKKPPAGWDPGVLRENPWFDWEYFISAIVKNK